MREGRAGPLAAGCALTATTEPAAITSRKPSAKMQLKGYSAAGVAFQSLSPKPAACSEVHQFEAGPLTNPSPEGWN